VRGDSPAEAELLARFEADLNEVEALRSNVKRLKEENEKLKKDVKSKVSEARRIREAHEACVRFLVLLETSKE
jgi:predicted nuclease with TOPRIM domain